MGNKSGGVISIGVNLDYKKELDNMMSSFEDRLNKIASKLSKTEITKDLQQQINEISQTLESVRRNMTQTFDELSDTKLDKGALTNYKQNVTKAFSEIDEKINTLTSEMSNMSSQFDAMNGKDFSSSIIKQYNEIKDSATATLEVISKMQEFVSVDKTTTLYESISDSDLKKYDVLKKTLSDMDKMYGKIQTKGFKSSHDILDAIYEYTDEVTTLESRYEELEKKRVELLNKGQSTDEIDVSIANVMALMKAYKEAAEAVDELYQKEYAKTARRGKDYESPISDEEFERFDRVESVYAEKLKMFKQTSREFISEVEEAKSSIKSLVSVDTFQVKNGSIHVPIEISTSNETLKNALIEKISAVQSKASDSPIVVPITLKVNNGNNTTPKSIRDATKQFKESANELEGAMSSADIDKMFKTSMTNALQSAYLTARAMASAIKEAYNQAQEELTTNPLKINIIPGELDKIKKNADRIMKKIKLEPKEIDLTIKKDSLQKNLDSTISEIEDRLGKMSIPNIDELESKLKNIVFSSEKVGKDVLLTPKTTGFSSKAKESLSKLNPIEYKVLLEPTSKGFKTKLDNLYKSIDSQNKVIDISIGDKTVSELNRLSQLFKIYLPGSTKQFDIVIGPETPERIKQLGELIENNIPRGRLINIDMDGRTIANIGNIRKLLDAQLGQFDLSGLDKLSSVLNEITTNLSAVRNDINNVPVKLVPSVKGFKSSAKSLLSSLPEIQKDVKITIPKLDTKTIDAYVNSLKSLSDAFNNLSQSEQAIVGITSLIKSISSTSGRIDKLKDFPSILNRLASSLNKFDSEKLKNINSESISSILKSLNISSKAGENIENLIKALGSLTSFFKSNNLSNTDFYKSISGLLTKTESLSDLATILKSSVKQINAAAKATKSTQLPSIINDDLSTGSNSSSSKGNFNSEFRGFFDDIDTYQMKLEVFQKAVREFYEGRGFNIQKLATNVDPFGNMTSKVTYFDKELQESATLVVGYNKELDLFTKTSLNASVNLEKLDEQSKKLGVQLSSQKFDSIKNVYSQLDILMSKEGTILNKNIDDKTGVIKADLLDVNGIIKSINVQLDSKGFVHWVSTGQKQLNFFKASLSGLGKQLVQLMAYRFTVSSLWGYFRNGISVLKDFDKALTSISYTMNISKESLDNLGKSVIEMANNLSTSVSNAMEVAQIYANMNTTAEEIQKMASPTIMLSNLTGIDASSAADEIQAVIQQFDMTAESSSHIVDVYDKISSNIAVDYSKGIKGMAEAVQVAGASADAAGLSFEQLSAIVAKTQETTRQEGSQIGNALKTIMVRLSKASNLEDEIDNDTLSNASKALHEIGIEVYNADGTFRSFKTIMSELSKEWDNLSDAQKANISYQIAA